jgi:archaemetzincin
VEYRRSVRRVVMVFGLLLVGCGRSADGGAAEPVSRESPALELASEATGAELEGALGEAPADEPQFRAKVILVPLRSFPDDLLDSVEESLSVELDVEVERHEVVALPDEAYYAPRKRYRAEKLLDFLEQYATDPDVKVLGVTEVDISTTGDSAPDWGIFGLGRVAGSTAVISSYRLKRKPKNREHVRFRVSNVAVHEVGHTFGLQHCDEKESECIMLDAEGGIENTDSSSGTFGPSCRKRLDALAPY